MKDPNMRARISQLHRTESEWNLLTNFVPMKGEVIVFDPDEQCPYARLKVGDGTTKLQELPFFIESAINNIVSKHYNAPSDAGRVTDYKK